MERLFCSSEEIFGEAEALLEERYGNLFITGNYFLDKLDSWPKVLMKDGLGPPKFTDLLRDLQFLNDKRQNRKILGKLWECLVSQWGRKVAQYT